MSKHMPYIFLEPGQIMAPGDETISPWGSWSSIGPKYLGRPVTERKAASVRRPIPDLLEALKALLAADRMECKPGSDDELLKIGRQVNAENLAEIAIAKAEGK